MGKLIMALPKVQSGRPPNTNIKQLVTQSADCKLSSTFVTQIRKRVRHVTRHISPTIRIIKVSCSELTFTETKPLIVVVASIRVCAMNAPPLLKHVTGV